MLLHIFLEQLHIQLYATVPVQKRHPLEKLNFSAQDIPVSYTHLDVYKRQVLCNTL